MTTLIAGEVVMYGGGRSGYISWADHIGPDHVWTLLRTDEDGDAEVRCSCGGYRFYFEADLLIPVFDEGLFRAKFVTAARDYFGVLSAWKEANLTYWGRYNYTKGGNTSEQQELFHGNDLIFLRLVEPLEAEYVSMLEEAEKRGIKLDENVWPN